MTDAAKSKPRLSLLSSKQQAVIRLKSDDQPDHQHVTVSNTPHQAQATPNTEDYANIESHHNSVTQELNNPQQMTKLQQSSGITTLAVEKLLANDDAQKMTHNDDENSGRPGDSAAGGGSNNNTRMNISKEDLIRLLSLLKSELQSKEIALAAIKCEQLKRLLNPVEISRSSLANTYIKLQDRLKSCDLNNNNNSKRRIEQPDSASIISQANLKNEAKRNESARLQQQQTKEQQQDAEEKSRESLNILNTLLELLDRHPLLALPRDSIYCLDYNCNEVSTKNYLNLKIQHLDNLIIQHRRYRYYMNERLKRSEQRYLDLAREMEIERKSKYSEDNSLYRNSGRSILLKHIDKLKETVEKEKREKEAIVMTLLNELLDEREKNEILSKKLVELESSKNEIASEKEKKMLMLQQEIESITMQLKKQSMVHAKERNELQSKVVSLESENASMKSKLVHQDRRLADQTKSSPGLSTTNQAPPPIAARSNDIIRQQTKAFTPTSATINTKQVSNVAARSPLSGGGGSGAGGSVLASKSSPPAKTTTVTSYSSNGSAAQQRILAARGVVVNASSPGDSDKATLASHAQQQELSRQAVLSPQQRSSSTTAPSPTVSRGLTGGSPAEIAAVRVQPLFKSASVSSTNQQARNLKTSISSVSGGSNASPSPARSSSGGQLLIKPQVPAKPAQLLDQQRKPIS